MECTVVPVEGAGATEVLLLKKRLNESDPISFPRSVAILMIILHLPLPLCGWHLSSFDKAV
jgi:hypothetical protein